jgi:hypothetical protein
MGVVTAGFTWIRKQTGESTGKVPYDGEAFHSVF